MTVETMRDQVKTLLGTVAGISAPNVLDIEEWSDDPDWFREHFVEPSGRACGWWIEHRPRRPGEHLGYMREVHEFRLRGVLGYQDAIRSKAEAEEMVQAVFEALRKPANRRLGGTVNFTTPPDDAPRPRPFWVEAGTDRFLCHYMEIVFTAEADVAFA